MEISSYITEMDEYSEKSFLGWIIAMNTFIDVPESFIHGTERNKLYKVYRDQYYDSGALMTHNVPLELAVCLSECSEWATPAKPDNLIKELKKYHILRELYTNVARMDNVLRDDPKKILPEVNKLSSAISASITDVEASQEYNHAESVYKYMEKIEYAQKHGKEFRGIKSHLPDLDNIISGWIPGLSYLISGLEKIGKSRFVRNLISTWLNQNYGCCVFVLEEDAEAIHECILACRAGVDSSVFGTSNMGDEALKKICMKSGEYGTQPMYISTKSNINPQYIKSTVQRQKIKMKKTGHQLTFVVIDYIQRMSGEGNGRHEQTENIASELGDIARDENVCLIEISQMSASAEKTKNIPLHTMIRFGKVFKEAASVIITFDDPERMGKKEDDDNMLLPESRKIIAHIIQRGGIGDVTIPLRAQLQYSQFNDEIKG